MHKTCRKIFETGNGLCNVEIHALRLVIFALKAHKNTQAVFHFHQNTRPFFSISEVLKPHMDQPRASRSVGKLFRDCAPTNQDGGGNEYRPIANKELNTPDPAQSRQGFPNISLRRMPGTTIWIDVHMPSGSTQPPRSMLTLLQMAICHGSLRCRIRVANRMSSSVHSTYLKHQHAASQSRQDGSK